MSRPLPPLTAERRARLDARRASRHFLLGRYRAGLLACMAVSLALALVLVHLPLYQPAPAVHWYPLPSREQLVLQQLELERGPQPGNGVPVTTFALPPVVEQDAAEGRDESEEAPLSAAPPEVPPYEPPGRMVTQRVLEFAETMPEIDGGLRNYYVHIEYPEEAAEAGIEGRLMLEFIVETDGTTSDVHVLQSLHPLCDSAAVKALRRTRFIPGRQNGERTRVRMRLPVRFRLVNHPARPTPMPSLGES